MEGVRSQTVSAATSHLTIESTPQVALSGANNDRTPQGGPAPSREAEAGQGNRHLRSSKLPVAAAGASSHNKRKGESAYVPTSLSTPAAYIRIDLPATGPIGSPQFSVTESPHRRLSDPRSPQTRRASSSSPKQDGTESHKRQLPAPSTVPVPTPEPEQGNDTSKAMDATRLSSPPQARGPTSEDDSPAPGGLSHPPTAAHRPPPTRKLSGRERLEAAKLSRARARGGTRGPSPTETSASETDQTTTFKAPTRWEPEEDAALVSQLSQNGWSTLDAPRSVAKGGGMKLYEAFSPAIAHASTHGAPRPGGELMSRLKLYKMFYLDEEEGFQTLQIHVSTGRLFCCLDEDKPCAANPRANPYGCTYTRCRHPDKHESTIQGWTAVEERDLINYIFADLGKEEFWAGEMRMSEYNSLTAIAHKIKRPGFKIRGASNLWDRVALKLYPFYGPAVDGFRQARKVTITVLRHATTDRHRKGCGGRSPVLLPYNGHSMRWYKSILVCRILVLLVATDLELSTKFVCSYGNCQNPNNQVENGSRVERHMSCSSCHPPYDQHTNEPTQSELDTRKPLKAEQLAKPLSFVLKSGNMKINVKFSTDKTDAKPTENIMFKWL